MAGPRSRGPLPTPAEAATLGQALHALGDYGHIAVRAARGHLYVLGPDGVPVARCTPLGGRQFGVSFHTHTGRWEPMPVVADLVHLAHALVTVLGPHLQRTEFSGGISGSDH